MEGEKRQATYEDLNHNTINKDNVYELRQVATTEERRVKQLENIKERKDREVTWNKLPIIYTVLLSLIVVLQVGILCLLLAQMSTRDTTCTTGATAGMVDDILLIAQELLVLHNDSTALPTSCKHLQEQQPNSPPGHYILAGPNGTYSTYCNMRELCGSGGGWTRLGYLDMSDATQNCPSGFRLYQSEGVRACGRPATGSASCVSVQFPSNGISYSQICGRVTGYQFYSPNAFFIGSSDINSYYVDGVSITRGSPRQHVWTLANDPTDLYTGANRVWMCPCVSGSAQTVPSFVGNHYYCESGNQAFSWSPVLYTSDPLWDGQNCGSVNTCCTGSSIPWFHRDYGNTTTTDYIELRVCADEGTANEDSPVSYYEIYIK